jgi:hypothetical protein
MNAQWQMTDGTDCESVIGVWIEQARVDGREDDYAGKRQHPRVTRQVPVTLEVDPDGRRPATVYGQSRDVSLGGIGVHVRQRIAAMSVVRITVDSDGTSVTGRVMHCTGGLGGYIVGIEFVREAAHMPAAQALRKTA